MSPTVDAGGLQAAGVGKPTINSVAAGGGENIISFTSGTGATSDNLYWSNTPTVTKLNGTPILGVTSPYVHSDLDNGTTYYYVATSEDAETESDESNESSGTPAASDVFILHPQISY